MQAERQELQPHETSFIPSASNERLLRTAFGHFVTGVTIVTTASSQRVVAITANSFTSVSMDPPIVLWSANSASKRFPFFASAQNFAIHVLASHQQALCWDTSKDMHALKDQDLPYNAEGVPLIDDCLARFECESFAQHPAGDHHLMLGRVLRAEINGKQEPLTFFKGQISKIPMRTL